MDWVGASRAGGVSCSIFAGKNRSVINTSQEAESSHTGPSPKSKADAYNSNVVGADGGCRVPKLAEAGREF
jgi:hypothetical protein